LQPARGLNFGATKYNDPPRVKTFDIKNEGLFAFVFCLAGPQPDQAAEDAILAATPAALLDPTKPAPAKVLPPTGPKPLGHFTVTPCGGLLEPGQTATVEVAFTPAGKAAYKEHIRLMISGRDPADPVAEAATAYELLVESCYPGIVTSEWRSIFEEQVVVEKLADYSGATVVEGDVKNKVGGGGIEGASGEGAVAAAGAAYEDDCLLHDSVEDDANNHDKADDAHDADADRPMLLLSTRR
jgi:hypothetical protein